MPISGLKQPALPHFESEGWDDEELTMGPLNQRMRTIQTKATMPAISNISKHCQLAQCRSDRTISPNCFADSITRTKLQQPIHHSDQQALSNLMF